MSLLAVNARTQMNANQNQQYQASKAQTRTQDETGRGYANKRNWYNLSLRKSVSFYEVGISTFALVYKPWTGRETMGHG
jgi:hypothetical protein